MKWRCFNFQAVREGLAAQTAECSLFSRAVITNPATGLPYLTRYILIRTPWFRVFLHRFHGPDPDRHCHNHPWLATSLILKGGYWEVVRGLVSARSVGGFSWWNQRARELTPGAINKLLPGEYHRITKVKPGTWTLVWGGAYFREWGFLVDGTHVDWRTYLNVDPNKTLED